MPDPSSPHEQTRAGHQDPSGTIVRAATNAADLTSKHQTLSRLSGNAVALRDLAKAIFQHDGSIAGLADNEFQLRNGTLLFRGVSHYMHVAANLNGDWFGTGFISNGNHYSHHSIREDSIEEYGFSRHNGWATAYKLAPEARIISAKDAEEMTLDQCIELAQQRFPINRTTLQILYHQTYDNGFRAILTGYDAMVDPETQYYVVYNNSLLVHHSDLTPWALGIAPYHTGPALPVDTSPKGAVQYGTIRCKVRGLLKEMKP